MTPFQDYLAALKKKLAQGDSTEQTHRAALQTLLEAVGKGITATNEPKRIACGAPDFGISRNKVPVGHVETKDIGVSLSDMERGKGPNGEQFKRYRDALPNWILTDYLEFRWFVAGEKRLTARIANLDGQGRIHPTTDGAEQLGRLLEPFFTQPALTVGTAKELAQRMAGMTRNLRDLIIGTFAQGSDSDKKWLQSWLTAFQEVLIPDLDEKQFADMFAQTLAYGLFAAKVHSASGKDFSRDTAARCLPKTNPFLRKLFEEFAGVSMPETFDWAVDDLVELLKHAAMDEVLKDFGKGKGKEDPVVHFYETFLTAYDPKTRELRGVYYTPGPVVSYIVRSIDHLLKTRFDRPKGLADENTLILDPATGTATFLYFVVRQICDQFSSQKGAWDSYVEQHLLNRLFGFELLMAPYAIAHLKLGMELQETGYSFVSDQRLGIYLTNSLEEAAKKSEKLFAQWISDEANAAADIKRDRPILVVLGNPPYSGHSANRSRDEKGKLTFIGQLIEGYRTVDGQPLGERNPKWLQDDYVKFIRFAQWRIEKTGYGVLGFITNHGYLDNPTFRGMRQSLMSSFNDIYVYNLHGNSKKKEQAPDGGKDENVFDIQQGVAIILAMKEVAPPSRRQLENRAESRQDAGATGIASVHHCDLWGSRDSKYRSLADTDIRNTEWIRLEPVAPSYLFMPLNTELLGEYQKAWRVPAIFPVNASTVTTARNHFSMAYSPEILIARINDLQREDIEDAVLRQKYGLEDVSYWSLRSARRQLARTKNIESFVKPYCYRPFDFRFVFYHESVCERLRQDVMRHMTRDNVAFLTHRPQSPGDFTFAYCTRLIGDQCVAANKTAGGGNSFQFPLYLYPDEGALGIEVPEFARGPDARRPNLTPAFVADLERRLGLTFVPDRSAAVPAASTQAGETPALPGALGEVSVRSRGRLPHWEAEGGVYFVTFRLADSLPQSVVESLEFERKDILATAKQQGRELTSVEQSRLDELSSERIEAYLDSGAGTCALARPEVAELVAAALRHFDSQRYRLLAWCIMPNHVHAVFTPAEGESLAGILHSWKSFTAKKANEITGAAGEFWQREYYDHLVRDADDLDRVVRYVAGNPAKAGLLDWKWVWISGAAVAAASRQDAGATGRGGSAAVPAALSEAGRIPALRRDETLFGPEDVFHYMYAVFHSPNYRTRYAEFLKTDFPRLPLTSNRALFSALVEKGSELVALHLMESPMLDNLVTTFPEKGSNVVERVTYVPATQRVSINGIQYFQGVPREVWEFHVGGYQVCEKWLKDRKGRTLTFDDLQHYQKIVVALKETIRLMAEIDQDIEAHGGWPLK